MQIHLLSYLIQHNRLFIVVKRPSALWGCEGFLLLKTFKSWVYSYLFFLKQGLPPTSAIPRWGSSKENPTQFYELLGFYFLKLTKAELLTL
jgi:hypothetical protein